MSQLTRRAFTQDLLGSLLTFSLLERVFSRGALAEDVKPVTAAWLAGGSWTAEINGADYPVAVSLKPLYDPTNARILA